MSTRCQIKVEGEEVLFYKHCDGYPEGVMPTLEAEVSRFKKARRFFDGPYLLARIGQAFMNKYDSYPLGYGYDTSIHGDIEYLYTVNKDFTITIEEM